MKPNTKITHKICEKKCKHKVFGYKKSQSTKVTEIGCEQKQPYFGGGERRETIPTL